MKILYHHRIRSKDGQYVHISEMVAALRRRGHEVVMVGPSGFGAAARESVTRRRLTWGGNAERTVALLCRAHMPAALAGRRDRQVAP